MNTQVKDQDRVITIKAGENAISVLYNELYNAILDAVRERRLLRCSEMPEIKNGVFARPFEIINGEARLSPEVRIAFFSNGSFHVAADEYYCTDNAQPIYEAAKDMYNTLTGKL